MVGVKQNLIFYGIEGLTESERQIINALFNWKHQERQSNVFNLKSFLYLSQSSVALGLRNLVERGIVQKHKGIYFLNSQIKNKIIEEKQKEVENIAV